MKVKAELWVRLKVTDLVSQTAEMTLTEKMNFKGILLGVARYSYWSFSADGDDSETVMSVIDREIRMDSTFSNQNKHVYCLRIGTGNKWDLARGDFRPQKDVPRSEVEMDRTTSVYVCDLLVTEQGGGRSTGYEHRLNSRIDGVVVSDMKSGEIWRILIKARNADEAALRAEEMAVSKSRREGLLLNPHYQEFEFIGTTVLGTGPGD
jgi:hypothetical protein